MMMIPEFLLSQCGNHRQKKENLEHACTKKRKAPTRSLRQGSGETSKTNITQLATFCQRSREASILYPLVVCILFVALYQFRLISDIAFHSAKQNDFDRALMATRYTPMVRNRRSSIAFEFQPKNSTVSETKTYYSKQQQHQKQNTVHNLEISQLQQIPKVILPTSSLVLADTESYDFGSLHLKFARGRQTRRFISLYDDQILDQQRQQLLEEIDRIGTIDGQDPDDNEIENSETQCRRMPWKSQNFPTCNSFHELDTLQQQDMTLLGAENYKDSYLVPDLVVSSIQPSTANFVLKRTQFPDLEAYDPGREPSPISFQAAQIDAIVMEKLTSSPFITDIYGFCGYNTFTEAVPQKLFSKIIPLNDSKSDIIPDNSLPSISPEDKLSIALQMAQAVAGLHGYRGSESSSDHNDMGVIVHADIHPYQFLVTEQGQVKLNDFNLASILDWKETAGEYCKSEISLLEGKFRAPEQVTTGLLDEKADVYCLANMFYSLLTGLEIDKDQVHRFDDQLKERSHIEASIVEITEKMWSYDPSDRPNIFEVVAFLQQLKSQQDEIRGGIVLEHADSSNGLVRRLLRSR